MITAEQLKELQQRAGDLGKYLEIEAKSVQLEEEKLRTQAPDFWDDPKKAEQQMKKVKELERWVDGYKEVNTLTEELALAFDFHKDGMITEEEVERIRTATAAYKKAVESGNTEEIIKEDEIFHKLIVDCSGNKTLIQMINQIQELALRFRYIYYEDFSRYKNMPYEHQEIMDAIVSGDAEKAREKADSHVLRLKEFVVEQGDKIVKGQNA